MEQKCVLNLTRCFGLQVIKAIAELGIEQKAWAFPPTQFWTKEYLASVPTINIWTKLHLYLAKTISREIQVNDLYNVGYLSVAVPYCDVVVADKAMVYLLTFRKLNEVYGTAVYSSLTDCVDYLKSKAKWHRSKQLRHSF